MHIVLTFLTLGRLLPFSLALPQWKGCGILAPHGRNVDSCHLPSAVLSRTKVKVKGETRLMGMSLSNQKVNNPKVHRGRDLQLRLQLSICGNGKLLAASGAEWWTGELSTIPGRSRSDCGPGLVLPLPVRKLFPCGYWGVLLSSSPSHHWSNLLFSVYMLSSGQIIYQHNIHFCCYAGDIHILCLCCLLVAIQESNTHILVYISDIKFWMSQNFFQLNESVSDVWNPLIWSHPHDQQL